MPTCNDGGIGMASFPTPPPTLRDMMMMKKQKKNDIRIGEFQEEIPVDAAEHYSQYCSSFISAVVNDEFVVELYFRHPQYNTCVDARVFVVSEKDGRVDYKCKLHEEVGDDEEKPLIREIIEKAMSTGWPS